MEMLWPGRVMGFVLAAALGTAGGDDPLRHPERVEGPACEQGRWRTPYRPRFAAGAAWVRVVEAEAPVQVDGLTVPVAGGEAAVTPFLRYDGPVLVECSCSKTPFLEITPRVFVALVTFETKAVRVLIRNTLENAVNVSLEAEGEQRSLYVGPETEGEVSFPPAAASLWEVTLRKHPEAFEGGYRFRRAVPVPNAFRR